jgi:preprotein translocase subunit SecA
MIWISSARAYGQRDPKVEYKMAAYDMFNEMLESIQQDTVRLLFHVRVEQKVEREQVAKVTGTNKDESGPRKPVQRAERKIYPNDPCPEAARSTNSAAEENRFDKSRTAVRRMSTIRLTKHAASLPEAACHTKYKTESR